MACLDRRMLAQNIVIKTYGSRDALLRVDHDHPFFFDHPLDHIPGLLLLEGATQLVQGLAMSSEYVAVVSARFIRYALFGSPVSLVALNAPDRGESAFDVIIEQNGGVRAEISVDLAPFTQSAPNVCLDRPVSPCSAEMLNKWRPENVLISEPRLSTDEIRAELLPAPSSCLLTDSFILLHPLHLLEAFMQVQRYINRLEGTADRMRDILTGVSIRQSAPTADKSNFLQILGAKARQDNGRRRQVKSASFFAASTLICTCTIETAQVSGAAIRQPADTGAVS